MVATVEGQYTPFAYLNPENEAAQKSLVSLCDRHGNSQSLVQTICQQPGVSGRAARSRYRLCLSFDNSGSDHNGSWNLGKGSAKFPVNLQLCSTRSRLLKGPILVIISIHPRSGAFILENISQHHAIEYLEAHVTLRYKEKHVLFMTENHLRFGPLDYVFEFDIASEADFSHTRAAYIYEQMHLGTKLPYPLLDTLPKPTHVRIGDIIIHQTLSKGTFGVVRVGVHIRSGEAVACKTIHCGQRDVTSVKREIILASETATTVGVVPLIQAWCEHGNPFPCNAKLEDVHLLSKR